jgi:hypothetical protein
LSTENWSQERDRLLKLLEAVKSGAISHIDEEDLRQLQATNEVNVAALEARLAELNKRLG